jgi:hypothetical protein
MVVKRQIYKFKKIYFKFFRVPVYFLKEGLKLSSFTLINYIVGFFLLFVFGVNLWISFDYLAFFYLILFPIIISVWKMIMTSSSSYTWADGTTTDGDESTFLKRIINQALFLSGLTLFLYFLLLAVG